MKIIIDFIDQKDQRYDTLGDWFTYRFENNEELWQIKVTRQRSIRHQLLIAIHELVEMMICVHKGVDAAKVDEFDFRWKPRITTNGVPIKEPGDDPNAPYYDAHQVATVVERLMAMALDVHWPTYETSLDHPSMPSLPEILG